MQTPDPAPTAPAVEDPVVPTAAASHAGVVPTILSPAQMSRLRDHFFQMNEDLRVSDDNRLQCMEEEPVGYIPRHSQDFHMLDNTVPCRNQQHPDDCWFSA